MASGEEDIDKLKLPAALKLAKERNIPIIGLRDLEEIKWQLKKYLLAERRKRDDVIHDLMIAAEEDSKIRHELIKIYQKTIASLDSHSPTDPLIRSVSKCYKKTNIFDMLKKQKGKLDGEISRCPVLVLGDTGAGKSSFINLLLGQEVFPCSLLSNTSVICEIAYCDVPSAKLYPHDDEDDSVDMEHIQAKTMEDFDFEKLAMLVQQRDETKKRSKFKRAEIYFPLPVLKTGLIIVDSPGIGDVPEMTDIVLDYLMEASAFVFIINTIDGVQISRLEMLVEQLVKRVMTADNHYKPECAMFICNKWDQVPIDERISVHEDALNKLMKIWIGFRESQLYTLSTKEALWIQKDDLIVGRFEKILQGIINLLPPSRERLLTVSTGKLFEFLNNCMICIENNIYKNKSNSEEADRHQNEVCDGMKSLKLEVIEFFDQQKSGLESNLRKLAQDLTKHLRTEKVIKNLSNFDSTDQELVAKSFQEVAIVIRSRVYDGISKHIRLWEEQEKQLKQIGEQLIESFNEKFPKFNAQLSQVENLFRKNWRAANNDTDSQMEKTPLVPDVITDNFNNLNLGLKVILTVALSPVVLVGVIIRLPFWGLKQLRNMIKNEMLMRNFEKGNEKDKNKVIKEYRENVISKLTENSIINSCLESQLTILYQYIDNQKQKVIGQIDGKMDMLNTSDQDCSRSSNDTWVNSKSTVYVLLKNLEYFNMMLLPNNLHFASVKHFDVMETIAEGIMTQIVQAKDKKKGRLVAIRKSKLTVDMERIKKYQKEEEYYRRTGKPHIICVNIFIKSDMDIWQCFDAPKQSLRQFMKEKNYKEYDDSKLEVYHQVLHQVALGLEYLQQRTLVHIDLCQDIIMVDNNGNVVLVNISCPSLLDEAMFCADKTNVTDYTHFSADIISSPSMTVYERKHDMYSLGILMWEFWSQQSVFGHQMSENKITDLKTFADFLKVVDVKSLLPSLPENDNITSVGNTWRDIIIQSLNLSDDLTARRWIDSFIKSPCSDSIRDDPVSTSLYNRVSDVSSSQLYSTLH